ncbi:MAG: hypothetical protein A2043_04620 [Candidatus Schekmanbacteria bacterium GWA2_38_9]|uniref:FlgO domain-containing protein n=1 Tax=Candidatus Schekmanbacteria bacterium RIFCSPLOWO2_12_FULL_38_15 TaxID=1817883 RepID=A0A1F7SH10_9BACT|nr:MAG: hypothetical protein A2043_04620 [Candidatus Schekmanbacteria bacterium GWA2_38_9]OGL49682.1 MAG: hypothetical protein A3H37_01455 [Candidatus Schekmanbacteria bacterium RIFCSPLOWO2_02_FULL_38_14]OGL53035.1 MAG: hypothetical protein A3G31_09010 [Candidatus Schekmanbacteria bacterium RIFCSPLOWO2_12_FULL_38_15]
MFINSLSQWGEEVIEEFAMNKRIIFLFIALILLSSLLSIFSCSTPKGDPRYVKDGKQYGTTEGTFRNRWWNYYDRGNSFADGEFFEEAIADYRNSIKQRDEDQRRARTYGMHFIDYFPHRELGISYLNAGKIEDAIKELEASLSSVETAKAKYFLNKARQKFLLEKKTDLKPPSVTIASEKNNLITNEFSVDLEGTAEDDFYVSGITINEKPLRIELAEKRIAFKEKIPLGRGINQITIKAFDLTGKSSEKIVDIRADREGPMVDIESLQITETQGKLKAGILAYAYDDSEISSFMINGKEVLKERGKEVKISHEVDISGRNEKLIFEARDIIGNTTSGDLNQESLSEMTHYPQYAHKGNKLLALNPSFPAIKLKDLDFIKNVFLDRLYIEGSASSPNNIISLAINGESILKRKAKNIFFNFLTPLNKGENNIVVMASDENGLKGEKRAKVKREIEKVRDIGSRMSISILSFEKKGTPSVASDIVYDNLITSFENLKVEGIGRFNLVERAKLDEVLKEQKLSKTPIVDPETAARIGKIVAAEAILIGSIVETKDSIEIYARLVNSETSSIIGAKDVFDQNKSLPGIKTMTDGLALKFNHHLPLVEGLLIKKNGKEIFADIGLNKGLKKEMKFIVFKEGEKLVHPVTGKFLGSDTEPLGEAVIEQVNEDFSKGSLFREFKAGKIKVMDRVITK